MSSQSPVMRPGVEALSAGASGMAPGSMEELMQAQMNQIQQLIANGNDKLEHALGNRYTAGIGALREELLLYVGEHTANKKDMDKLAERFAESEVNNQRSQGGGGRYTEGESGSRVGGTNAMEINKVKRS